MVRSEGEAIVVDRLGSTRAWSGPKGGSTANYFPFGQQVIQTSDTKDSFGTYEKDATDLSYAWHRYYSSRMGRFTTPDPCEASIRQAQPNSWNRYAFASNDPINRIDPNGLYDYADAPTSTGTTTTTYPDGTTQSVVTYDDGSTLTEYQGTDGNVDASYTDANGNPISATISVTDSVTVSATADDDDSAEEACLVTDAVAIGLDSAVLFLGQEELAPWAYSTSAHAFACSVVVFGSKK